jgi:hypothetical protein
MPDAQQLRQGPHLDIHELAQKIQAMIEQGLSAILPERQLEFDARFAKDGDMAYGTLNTELFAPVRVLLREHGLQAKPRLPGRFNDSREWGNADESHQERWMWSVILRDGMPIGTIAVGSHHDHSCFRLPRSPQVIGISSTTPRQIVSELGSLMPAFAAAQPFQEWYRDYLAANKTPPE